MTPNDDDRHLPVPFETRRRDDQPRAEIVPAHLRVPIARTKTRPATADVLSTYVPPDARVLPRWDTEPTESAPPQVATQRTGRRITPRPALQPMPEPRRIGWALVIAALAETVIAVAAIMTASYVIGLFAALAIAICGLFLIVAEAVSRS